MTRQANARPLRRLSSFLVACAVAAVLLGGCGPIYTASETYLLARDLEARPLDIEFNLRGMLVRFETDGSIVEGAIAETDVEALRIGQTWYPIERMRDPGDDYIRNLFTTVTYMTRFIDAETGALIDDFIDANRVRRIRIGEHWYELSRIRFLDSPRFDDPDRWVERRVRVRTRDRRTYEGPVLPIDAETFSIDGAVLAVSDLEALKR